MKSGKIMVEIDGTKLTLTIPNTKLNGKGNGRARKSRKAQNN